MSLSPMMQQYQQAKQAVGDALLLFRMGDFYELFHQDAKDAAALLGIALTSRDKGENPIPMAGFPHHQLDSYLAKIVRTGRRAAVCEQLENPKQAKGLVKRDVTRIVSSGTLTDESLLEAGESNYLAAIAPGESDATGVAWVDVSTGQFIATTLPVARLADELTRLGPAECLLPEEAPADYRQALPEPVAVTVRPPWAFNAQSAQDACTRLLGVRTLEGFGFDVEAPADRLAISAAGAVIDYLQETQKASLAHLHQLRKFDRQAAMQIDASTWRSLEITQTLREGRREQSLLGVIDRTVTSPGARLLGDWLRHPLTEVQLINRRLDAVEELVDESNLRSSVRDHLRGVYDLERLLSRVTLGRASPRDLRSVAQTLARLPELKAKLAGRKSQRLTQIDHSVDLCSDVRGKLEAALADDCPRTCREGGFVRASYSVELDACRELMSGGKQWMARYQATEMERTGIPSIKIGFNRVFGYYLEVTHAHREKIPAEYHRKQTLKNAERYITPELKEHEEKVLAAEDRSREIELAVFDELRELVAGACRRLLATSAALAELDVLASLAELAIARDYRRPQVVAEPILEIEEGRHPVLDVTEPEGTFVPNGCVCAGRERAKLPKDIKDPPVDSRSQILLITGPNMAGKSTYIRQMALLTLLAQIGSFLPARRATVGVADKLFARIGASDELSRGQSTFMVEMTEAARILNTATSRSLVVLDEIGRGTSTYDGLSIAWAIVEHLHDAIGCRTLFATHYHELTALEGQRPGVANRNVAVEEHGDSVVFLHRIVEGAADRSYGIHVAQIAGTPKQVTARAEEVLAELEREQSTHEKAAPRDSTHRNGGAPMQMTLFDPFESPVVEALRTLDLDGTTPLDALTWLKAWQERLVEETSPSPRPQPD